MAGAEPRRLPLLLLLVFPSSPVGAALRLLLGAAPPFTCSQPVSAAAARGALGARWRRPAGRQAAGPGKGTGLAASPAVRAAGRARRRGRGGKEGGGPASCGVSGRRRQLPAGVPRGGEGGGSPTGGRGPDRGEERPGSRGEGAASPVEGLRGSGGRQRDLALPGKGLSGGGRGAPGRGPEPGPVPLPSERGAARALGRTPRSRLTPSSGPAAADGPGGQSLGPGSSLSPAERSWWRAPERSLAAGGTARAGSGVAAAGTADGCRVPPVPLPRPRSELSQAWQDRCGPAAGPISSCRAVRLS